MLLTVVTVGTSALDIIIQAVAADPTNKTFVIIAGGSYFLTVKFYLTRLILLKLLIKAYFRNIFDRVLLLLFWVLAAYLM